MSKRSVLVVEDEVLIRMTLADALEDAGYTVIDVSNALQAVAVLGSGRTVDAIISDIDMPGSMDGLGLMRLVAGLSPRRALIVTSGNYGHDFNDLAQSCHFIAKPYDLADILTELDRQFRFIDRPLRANLG